MRTSLYGRRCAVEPLREVAPAHSGVWRMRRNASLCRYSLEVLRDAVLTYTKSTFFLMHRTSLRGAPF